MADTIERMGRKKAQPDAAAGAPAPASTGTDTIRVAKDLAHKLTVISIRRGVTVAELVGPHLRPWVEELYRQTVRQMCDELEQSP